MAQKKGPDMELRKAFVELQSKMVDTRTKMKFSDMQIENLKRAMTHAELTEKEMTALPEDTRLYASVGRMFLLSSKPEVIVNLGKKQGACKEKIKTLEANKDYLERSLKESENSLRELVSQKR